MAVDRKDEIRLLAIKVNSWKRIEQRDVFDSPEKIYIFDRLVKLPWNENSKFFKPNRFTPAQIKKVCMLENVVDKVQ